MAEYARGVAVWTYFSEDTGVLVDKAEITPLMLKFRSMLEASPERV